ncbi:MAG: triose-phosphate isomerase [Clostridiales bacterium]|jgi:triosephosphate isomerase|nr:triose-phosphate isomerase [Clostridiales bacterium]
MRKLFIAGNWKMNKTMASAKEFANVLKSNMMHDEVELAVIAPYTQLEILVSALYNRPVMVGAQNVFQETSGAYTGEISIEMLKEIDVDCCVIGHSERRQYFNETDEIVNKKLKLLLENDIRPIMCVGENLEVRKAGNAISHVKSQLEKGLMDINSDDVMNTTIAYEPIWAIGTGETASPEQAEEICSEIRNFLSEKYGEMVAEEVIIQYGGSVKPENAEEILRKPNIDGALIGGASLDVDMFMDIYDKAYFTKKH